MATTAVRGGCHRSKRGRHDCCTHTHAMTGPHWMPVPQHQRPLSGIKVDTRDSSGVSSRAGSAQTWETRLLQSSTTTV
jgi:hypothetical protein